MGRIVAVVLLQPLVGGCGDDGGTKGNAAPTAKPQAEPAEDDVCARAAWHITFGVIPEHVRPTGPEALVMDAVVAQATERCRVEGLSSAQADCIFAVKDVDALLSLGECPAIAARKPSWLRLPPPGALPADRASVGSGSH